MLRGYPKTSLQTPTKQSETAPMPQNYMERKLNSRHNRVAMPISIRFLIAALLLFPLTGHASPILGGSCYGGTLAEYIALGDAGCYMTHGERIYDISVDLPAPADLSAFHFAVSDIWTVRYSEATARLFPVGSVLTVHFQAPSAGVTGDWYQFDNAGNLASSLFTLSAGNADDVITMRATIPDAYLGFRLAQVAPEPSAFLPLLAGLLIIARYGVRNSSSR